MRIWFLFMMISLVCVSCEPGYDEGTLKFIVSAQQSACPGATGGGSLSDMVRVKVDVTQGANDTAVVASKEAALSGGTTELALAVPVGKDYTVTIQGFSRYSGSAPSWYAREREVSVRQGEDTSVELFLKRYKGYTCINPSPNLTDRLFPVVVDLKDGRVLIAGGFLSATQTGAGSGRYELGMPSKLAFIYDTRKGTVTQVGNGMNEGRAAASGAFVEHGKGKVVIFGGARKMTVQVRGDFDLYVAPEDALDTYEVFDVGTLLFESPAQGEDWKMTVPRVWPATLALADNAVLVVGSGGWPGKTTSVETRIGDIWMPEIGILPRGAASERMNSEHFAPAVAIMDKYDGRIRAIFFGGTLAAGSVFELYTESSSKDVAGSFIELGKGSIDKLPLLASLAPLGAGFGGDETAARFLAVGGVVRDGQKYVPSTTAYVVTVKREATVSLVETRPINNVCARRFFHAVAPTVLPKRVTLLGGFTGEPQDPSGGTCFFDIALFDKALKETSPVENAFWQPAAGEEVFPARGGHGFVTLKDDTVLTVGGMETTTGALNGQAPALLMVYAPPTIELPK